jgi:hypothetical protein
METGVVWLLVVGPLLMSIGAAIYWGNGSKLTGLWTGFVPGAIAIVLAAGLQTHIIISKSGDEQSPSEAALAALAKTAKETADRQIALERPLLNMMVSTVDIPWLRKPAENGKGRVIFSIFNGGKNRGIITKAFGGVKILSSFAEEAGVDEWPFLRRRSFGSGEEFKFEIGLKDNVSAEDQAAVKDGKKVLVFYSDFTYLGLLDDPWSFEMRWVYDPKIGSARPIQAEEFPQK